MRNIHNLLLVAPLLIAAGCDEMPDEVIDGEEAEFVDDPIEAELDAPLAAPLDASEATNTHWRGPVSEEQQPLTCAYGTGFIGAKCDDDYCDNFYAYCGDVGGQPQGRYWTAPFVSGEDASCDGSGTAYVSGLTCSGGYCGKISLECTKTTATFSNCDWTSERFTNGDPSWFPTPHGNYVVTGLRCTGTHCSTKEARICLVTP